MSFNGFFVTEVGESFVYRSMGTLTSGYTIEENFAPPHIDH